MSSSWTTQSIFERRRMKSSSRVTISVLRRSVQFHAEVVGRAHHVLGHLGVFADRFEHRERPAPVAPPQPVGQRLGVGLRAVVVEPHQAGLTVELVAGGCGRFAVPVVQVGLERHAERFDLVGDLLADVDAVGELAAEHGDDRRECGRSRWRVCG